MRWPISAACASSISATSCPASTAMSCPRFTFESSASRACASALRSARMSGASMTPAAGGPSPAIRASTSASCPRS
ncbi:hypothetical protein MOP88_18100 [Sphingomonas sp. WKB10]|nr:hypothetical protein [Sphingomonas sp. WKB10]